MSNTTDKEINAMKRIYKILQTIPKDGQFRALAFMVDHTANVSNSAASDFLYQQGRLARAEREAAEVSK